jgi:hypothetical protein
MQSFLDKVAQHIDEKFGSDFSGLCIVVPNRRAGLFLKKYLAQNNDKPIWSPEIFSIEDFVFELTELQRIDPLYLQFDLYNVYSKLEKDPKPFYEFTNFGQVILSDFNDIDLYLVDPDEIFDYLTETKAIKLWNPDGKPLTEFEKQYLQFYKSLGPLYHELSSVLLSKKQVYDGLAYKTLATNLKKEGATIRWKSILFAGFNALTTAEKQIISALKNRGVAELVWDADSYYLDNPAQEAGRFLRQNVRWLNEKELHWNTDSFLNTKKEIQIIGVPKNIGQVKLAGNIVRELSQKGLDLNSTAVVLNNESLALAMLNSLPQEVKEFNFTMGMSLKETPLYKLFGRILTLHENSLKYNQYTDSVPLYHYNDLIRVLEHPYIKNLINHFEGEKNERIKQFIVKKNKTFLKAAEITELGGFGNLLTLDFLDKLFNPWQNSPGKAIEFFTYFIEELKKYFTSLELEVQFSKLEIEFIFHFAKIVNKLREIISSFKFVNDLKTLRTLIQQIIHSITIPFYGEPLKGIQVMGMLETRVLDFENIIMLSVNEDFIPSTKTSQSFIPYEIRKESHFGLPTYHERNAVFAYHFYRLLQRSDNAYLIYNTEADALGGGDKSRFVTQMLNELQAYNKNVRITEKLLTVPPQKIETKDIRIPMNDTMMSRLRDLAIDGFSASSLNIFRSCSLRFYFQYIIGIEENEEVEETIEASTLGNVVHDVLKKLYVPYRNKVIATEQLQEMKLKYKELLHQSFLENYRNGDIQHGKNLLVARVAETYVLKFLNNEISFIKDRKKFNEYLNLLSLEQEYSRHFILNLGEHQQKIKLRGFIDRVDRVGQKTRIIDYKTGNVSQGELQIKEWDDFFKNPKFDKSFQLLFYKYIFGAEGEDAGNISPGIISFRNMKSGFLELKASEEDLNSEFEKLLARIFSDIFNKETTFEQTQEIDNCKYCPYVSICNR